MSNTDKRSVLLESASPPSTPPFLLPSDNWRTYSTTRDECPEPTWWIVEWEATEVWVTGGGPAPDPMIPIPGAPPALTPSTRSSLYGSISWSNHTGRTLYFDLGTTARYSVFARSVEFNVIAPGPQGGFGSRTIVPGQALNVVPVAVTRVDSTVYPTQGPIGDRQGRVTIRVEVAPATQPVVQVPAGTTDLMIYETSDGGAKAPTNTNWEWIDRQGLVCGSLNLVGGQSTAPVYVPGYARFLRLAGRAPLADPGTFSLAFNLRW